MEQQKRQLLGQNSLKNDYDHKIWNLNDDYSDFGSNGCIFEDFEIKNNTPPSHGKIFYQNCFD